MREIENESEINIRILAEFSWGFAFLVGFLGNVLLVNTISKILQLRKNIPNVIILILSIVDLLTVLVTYIHPIIVYINGTHLNHGKIICRIQIFLVVFFHFLSILLLLAIVFDRYYAVGKPYFYQEHMIFSMKKVAGFCTVLFLLSFGLSLPIVMPSNENEPLFSGNLKSHDYTTVIVYTIILSLVILLVVIGSLGSIFIVCKMNSFRERHSAPSHQTNNSRNQEEFLFIRLNTVTMVIFLVIWLPLLVVSCLYLRRKHLSDWFILLAFRMAALHSVVNPWLYPILRKRFRKALVWHITIILHYVTCTIVDGPITTLIEIVGDNQRTQKSDKQQPSSPQKSPSPQNIQMEIAQRNITDYVDANIEKRNESWDVGMQSISGGHDIVMSSHDEYLQKDEVKNE